MAKTAQVNGQMELNFTEQKFPKKRSRILLAFFLSHYI